MSKLTFIIIVSFIIVLIIVLGVLFYLRITSPKRVVLPENNPTLVVTPYPTALPTPSSEKIQSAGIDINNPYTGAKELTIQGDALSVSTDTYRILYLKQFDQFLINITRDPFSTNRIEAEKAFLEKLGITEQDACQLDVTVNEPRREGAPRLKYKLSFCE